MIINFKITNITCEACVKLSKAVLGHLQGVKRIEIDKNGLATVESDTEISFEEIKNALLKVDKNILAI